MTKAFEAAEHGYADVAPARRSQRRGIRRALGAPLAIVSTVAVMLGIAQPAEAAPQPTKRHVKAKATGAAGAHSVRVRDGVAAAGEVMVVDGDTVSGIAERFGLPTAELLAINGLGWSSLIFAGQRLALPGSPVVPASAPEPAPEITKHLVVDGDTVSGIAEQYGLDVASVLTANGLGAASIIFPGEAIVLPLTAATPISAAPEPSAPPSAAPTPGAPVVAVASVSVPLTDEMRAHARVIIDVGRSLGVPEQGIVVALAAAAQESGLKNVPYGDGDSLGLFRQRPGQGWGTVDDVLDPVRAATAFYGDTANPNPGRTSGLLDIGGWDAMTVTEAAQAVQRSAHPDHYAKWEASARAWLSELG